MSEKVSSLSAAVRAEADNWKSVGSLYGQAALELSALFASKGNPAVHVYMCQAQDLTGDPMVWNRAMSGLKKALSALPSALVFTATRDFRATHRNRAPLFELATKASEDQRKAEAARVEGEKAKAIEAAAAAERAEAEAAARAKVTAMDIAESVRANCADLGISLMEVLAILNAEPAELAKAA